MIPNKRVKRTDPEGEEASEKQPHRISITGGSTVLMRESSGGYGFGGHNIGRR